MVAGRSVPGERTAFSTQRIVLQGLIERTTRALDGREPLRLILAGPPGCGKSVVLSLLYDAMARKDPQAPEQMAKLADAGLLGVTTLEELLSACAGALPRGPDVPADASPTGSRALSKRARGGPILLLLDALPEAFVSSRGQTGAGFAGFLAKNRGISVVGAVDTPAGEVGQARIARMNGETFRIEEMGMITGDTARRFLLHWHRDLASTGRTGLESGEAEGVAGALAGLCGGNLEYLTGFAPLLGEAPLVAVSRGLQDRVRGSIAARTGARMALLSPQQRRILVALAQTGGRPLSVKELSERTRATSQTCSKQLHGLHKGGWVVRHPQGRESRYEMRDVLGRLALELQFRGGPAPWTSFDTLMMWHARLGGTPSESETYESPWLAIHSAADACDFAREAVPVAGRSLAELEEWLSASREALDSTPGDPRALVAELRCLLVLGRFGDVVPRARDGRALRKPPAGWRGLVGLFEAAGLLELGEAYPALKALEDAFAETGVEGPAATPVARDIVLGRIHQALGNAEAASKAFTAAFRGARAMTGPARFGLIAQSLLDKGVLLGSSNAPDKALQTFGYAEEAAEVCAEAESRVLLGASAAFNTGMTLVRAGRGETAVPAFDRALDAADSASFAGRRIAVKALLGRAGVLRGARNYSDAFEACDAAIAAAEEGSGERLLCETLLAKASLLWAHGRPADATALHDRVIALHPGAAGRVTPELAQALGGKALAQIANGNAGEALGVVQELLDLQPGRDRGGDVSRASALALEGYLCAFGLQEDWLRQARVMFGKAESPFLAQACLLWLKRRLPFSPETAARLANVEEAMDHAFEGEPALEAFLAMFRAARRMAAGEPGALLELPAEYRALIRAREA